MQTTVTHIGFPLRRTLVRCVHCASMRFINIIVKCKKDSAQGFPKAQFTVVQKLNQGERKKSVVYLFFLDFFCYFFVSRQKSK
jgi:hypothetical protein